MAIFTEGGAGVGMGHLSRCSAVAEELLRVGMSVEVFVQGPAQSLGFFPGCSAAVTFWTEDGTFCRTALHGVQVVLFDSYRPTPQFYRDVLLDYSGVPVFFDDLGSPPLDWGIAINGAPNAGELYGSTLGLRILAGVEYQALRPAFRNVPSRVIGPVVHDILVTLGGDDIHQLAPEIYRQLTQSQEGWSLTFITTENSRTRPELQALVKPPHRLVVDASATEMKQEFFRADLAVSAAGQTTFEMAVTGLPAVLIQVAENQRQLVSAWGRLGCAPAILSIEEAKDPIMLFQKIRGLLPLAVRQQIAHRGQQAVDGRGAQRIVEVIIEEGLHA